MTKLCAILFGMLYLDARLGRLPGADHSTPYSAEVTMPSLFGQSYTREQLMRRGGHLSQIGGVQLLACEDGPARGVRQLEFRTGTGLVFNVGIERGMDVGYCEYRGHSLA